MRFRFVCWKSKFHLWRDDEHLVSVWDANQSLHYLKSKHKNLKLKLSVLDIHLETYTFISVHPLNCLCLCFISTLCKYKVWSKISWTHKHPLFPIVWNFIVDQNHCATVDANCARKIPHMRSGVSSVYICAAVHWSVPTWLRRWIHSSCI